MQLSLHANLTGRTKFVGNIGRLVIAAGIPGWNTTSHDVQAIIHRKALEKCKYFVLVAGQISYSLGDATLWIIQSKKLQSEVFGEDKKIDLLVGSSCYQSRNLLSKLLERGDGADEILNRTHSGLPVQMVH